MIKQVFFLVLCALLPALLSACAQKWEKAGATEGDFDALQIACTDKAMKRYPPILREVEIESARVNPVVTSCTGTGPSMRCGTSGGRYEPPKYMPVDDNQRARENIIRGCYVANGWHLVDDD